MTRMTDHQEEQRASIEDCLAMLSDIDVHVRHIEIRVRFLRERYAEQTNTAAITTEIDGIRRNVSIIRAELAERHAAGERDGWTAAEILKRES